MREFLSRGEGTRLQVDCGRPPRGAIASLIVGRCGPPNGGRAFTPQWRRDGVRAEAGDQSHEQPVSQRVWAAGLGVDADQLRYGFAGWIRRLPSPTPATPPGRTGIAIALDPAASEFHKDGSYHVNGKQLSSHDMVERYAAMIEAYPIWSIEDGLGESDHDGWQELTTRLGGQIQLVGDDNFCTNPAIITAAIADGIANSALIKLNQIGTVSETLDAIDLARRNGYTSVISHRSGETEDTFIADLAVATGAGQIKTGSASRTDRVAKYNQLLRIEEELGDSARFLGLKALNYHG